MPLSGHEECWSDWPLFEALFERFKRPTGAYAAALCQAGFDPAAPRPRYPTAVWGRCVRVAREHLYPELSESEGFRRLGTDFLVGFGATALGRFMLSGVPPRGPEGVVQSMPRYWGMTCTGTHIGVTRVAPGHWQAEVHDPHVPPDFTAGSVEVSLRMTCPHGTVQVGARLPGRYVLDFRW